MTKKCIWVKIINAGGTFMAILSPSILNTNSYELDYVIKNFEQSNVDMIHIDVMDGKFVPNTAYDISDIEAIYKKTSLPLDIHLMIEAPFESIDLYSKFAKYIGIHYESKSNCKETLFRIKENGCKSCLVIKPKTEINEIKPLLKYVDMVLVMSVEPGFGGQKFIESTVNKIRTLKDYLKENKLNVLIEVDGGVNDETGKKVVNAGADVLVVGSYLFSNEKLNEKIVYFKNL